MGEESENSDNKVGIVANVSKKPRHRKKQLYQTLKKQMEFYFSDCNIAKNRFMNNLLEQSPHVDLTVFLGFNRIKAMTSNTKDIAKALQTSEFLKISDCGTKVYRVAPPQNKQNSDECTIYIEQLPVDGDHNWLTDVFQVYGPIDYVSIPKFKHSRKNKGFAFVEFKEAQAAKTALAAFSEMGCCLSNQMNPGNLYSIKTFEENENEVVNKKYAFEDKIDGNEGDVGKTRKDSITEDSVKSEDSKSVTVSRKRKKSTSKSDDSGSDCKRKLSDTDGKMINTCLVDQDKSLNAEGSQVKHIRKFSESNSEAVLSDSEIPNKIIKTEPGIEDNTSDFCNTENSSLKDVTDDNIKCEEMVCAKNDNEETEDYLNTEEERRNKNRKRRKKNKKNKVVDNTHGLQILSKPEWKSLRNKYLDEQRKKMKEFKQYIHRNNYNRYQNREENYNRYQNREETIKREPDDSQQDGDKDIQKGDITVSNKLKLTPGVIVKITVNEPVSKPSFKNEAKVFTEIKYIDIEEGSNVIYVRFSSTTAAEDCVKSGHWTNSEIIKGKEEKSYWDKVIHEREEKLSKGRSVKKGRDKLLKKAEDMQMKHIWFD